MWCPITSSASIHRKCWICQNVLRVTICTSFISARAPWSSLTNPLATQCDGIRRDQPGKLGLGKRIALDIACGLNFLHTHRIVHMDVKSPNVLLGQNSAAKLADVGLAKCVMSFDPVRVCYCQPTHKPAQALKHELTIRVRRELSEVLSGSMCENRCRSSDRHGVL